MLLTVLSFYNRVWPLRPGTPSRFITVTCAEETWPPDRASSWVSRHSDQSTPSFSCHLNLGEKTILGTFNPYPAKLIYLNFQPLEVVNRGSDPQPQVVENCIIIICLI